MKAYKLVVTVIDFDGLDSDGIKAAIESTRYPNDCIHPDVHSIEEADIGEWTDDHPLNNRTSAKAEYRRLFGI